MVGGLSTIGWPRRTKGESKFGFQVEQKYETRRLYLPATESNEMTLANLEQEIKALYWVVSSREARLTSQSDAEEQSGEHH